MFSDQNSSLVHCFVFTFLLIFIVIELHDGLVFVFWSNPLSVLLKETGVPDNLITGITGMDQGKTVLG